MNNKKVISVKVSMYLLVFFSIICSCDSDNSVTTPAPDIIDPETVGSGFFNYEVPNNLDLIMRVFYHVPENTTAQTPVLFVFHGNGRNARDYRDAMVAKSESLDFIVIAPEFSISNFASGDQYNLGNVFVDGDNPSPSTLNAQAVWSFSIIEPLFDDIKQRLNNDSGRYSIFGHSAGAQFAHRLISFKPNSRVDKIVASASGWYTVPDTSVSFPYGFNNAPLDGSTISQLLAQPLTILIGSADNDPNAAALRRNSIVDLQGTNRLARAQYFYNYGLQLSNSLNTEFNWSLVINPGADHDYQRASTDAADLLYNP
jgi:pimeloyl-ACP methyl ester carboxylesterase